MIYVDMPLAMTCDAPPEDGGPCSEHFAPQLVLLTGGGFGVSQKSLGGWQLVQAKGTIGGPFLCRCPKHHTKERLVQPVKLQIGPAGRRLVTGGR